MFYKLNCCVMGYASDFPFSRSLRPMFELTVFSARLVFPDLWDIDPPVT
jgi:hypothetical protein